MYVVVEMPTMWIVLTPTGRWSYTSFDFMTAAIECARRNAKHERRLEHVAQMHQLAEQLMAEYKATR